MHAVLFKQISFSKSNQSCRQYPKNIPCPVAHPFRPCIVHIREYPTPPHPTPFLGEDSKEVWEEVCRQGSQTLVSFAAARVGVTQCPLRRPHALLTGAVRDSGPRGCEGDCSNSDPV